MGCLVVFFSERIEVSIGFLSTRNRKQSSKKSGSFNFGDLKKMGLVNGFVG